MFKTKKKKKTATYIGIVLFIFFVWISFWCSLSLLFFTNLNNPMAIIEMMLKGTGIG